MNMGERLKELRLKKGVTQEDVGKVIHVSKATIMKYEKGLVENLKRSSIKKLADYFDVAPSFLMCMENDVENKELDNSYFEYVLEDDAMFPLLDTGDIALVYKQDKLDDILTPNKGTYLIKLNNKNTIRKIELSEDKTFYILVAMNAYYKVIQIPKDELYVQIQILGKVIKAENKSAFK